MNAPRTGASGLQPPPPPLPALCRNAPANGEHSNSQGRVQGATHEFLPTNGRDPRNPFCTTVTLFRRSQKEPRSSAELDASNIYIHFVTSPTQNFQPCWNHKNSYKYRYARTFTLNPQTLSAGFPARGSASPNYPEVSDLVVWWHLL